MQIVPFEPAAEAAEERDAWVRLHRAARCIDRPDDPALPAPFLLVAATTDMEGNPGRSWLARDGSGAPTGAVTLVLPEHDNPHTGLVDLTVDPVHRRQGIGRDLLNHVSNIARQSGRSLLIGQCAAGTAGPAFAAAVGAERGLVQVRRVLDLPVDTGQVTSLIADASDHARGFSLLRWQGRTPDEHRDDMVVMHEHMSDAPVDDLDLGRELWTPERLDHCERARDEAEVRVYVVAARHEASGRLAGFTDVWVHAGQPTWAWQGDTVVLPEHRGHRVGMLIKASMLAWLAEAEPQIRRIDTENAGSNRHMVAINETLGYRALDELEEWQVRL